jgi:SAM-dependent methyltransferase
VLLQEHTENHADDPTWWWTLVGYLKAHHFAGRLQRFTRQAWVNHRRAVSREFVTPTTWPHKLLDPAGTLAAGVDAWPLNRQIRNGRPGVVCDGPHVWRVVELRSIPSLLPGPVRSRLRRFDRSGAIRYACGLTPTPPVGHVMFGDFRRTRPIASDFGYGRGGPVDRYYIEAFLLRHRHDVRGRVLEIGDDTYTRRFGEDRVTRADVLHIDKAASATFTGDISDGSFLPDATFDCIILTQTLHLVYDFQAALRNLRRALSPGGVLLVTVPGISNIDRGEWGASWYFAFTHHSLQRMAEHIFEGFDVEVTSYGNVLAAVAFLHGLSSQELSHRELDDGDLEYSVIHAVRLMKPLKTIG